MYSYRDYCKSHKVTENGAMGRHTNNSPPPVLCDGKRRPIRDRLQSITAAMSWIKEELEVIKEQDESLKHIFEKVRGDVQELNSYISVRGSISVPSTPSSAKPQTLPNDLSLELDFDALDDEPTQNGGLHNNSSLSGSPSSPNELRELTSSGTSYSNLDVGLVKSGSHGSNSSSRSPNLSGQSGDARPRVREVAVDDKEDSLENPSNMSISLGSLDLDFPPISYGNGLGTITEGRSLLNIPITTATSSSSGNSSNGNSPSLEARMGGIQRSISQQPLAYPDIAGQGRKFSYQQPKKEAPQTLPKPRRDSQRQATRPPQPTADQQTLTNRRSSFTFMGGNLSRMAEMMRSTPALDKKSPTSSPSQSQKKTDHRGLKLMAPLLSLQAQQELRDAAKQLKQEARSRAANGVVPQLQAEPKLQGESPLSHRRQAPVAPSNKQPSPPLSNHSKDALGNVRLSPRHRASPTSSRYHPVHDVKTSSGTHKLTPPISRVQEMTNTSTISRDSSVDSGIQFAGDGENGGGVTSDSVNLGGSECVTTEDSGEGVKVEKKLDSKTEDQGLGFGDFASDVFSAIANMEGAGGSWLS